MYYFRVMLTQLSIHVTVSTHRVVVVMVVGVCWKMHVYRLHHMLLDHVHLHTCTPVHLLSGY